MRVFTGDGVDSIPSPVFSAHPNSEVPNSPVHFIAGCNPERRCRCIENREAAAR